MLPTSEITFATPIQFKATDPEEVRSVLTTWKGRVNDDRVKRAIDTALTPQATS